MTGRERARLNVLQTLEDLGAASFKTAALTRDVDHIVGDLSRYALSSNTKIVQSLLQDDLVNIDLSTPMKLWLTARGRDYLASEDKESLEGRTWPEELAWREKSGFGELRRPFPETDSDWVALASDIKEKSPEVDWPLINTSLNIILGNEEGNVDNAKRWLVNGAKELGIT